MTVVVVSHRLSTIRDADEIAVLKYGRLVEYGTHDALVQSGGTYAKLVNLDDGSGEGREEGENLNSAVEGVKEVKDGSSESDETDKMSSAEFKKHAKSFFMRKDAKWLVITLAGALLAGLVFPFWGWLFALMIKLLFRTVYKCTPASLNTPNSGFPNGIGQFYPTCEAYFESERQATENYSYEVAAYWSGLVGACFLGYTALLWGGGKVS
jgi:ATP-binding cassette subfamily B (MDR/TAP) protein 1